VDQTMYLEDIEQVVNETLEELLLGRGSLRWITPERISSRSSSQHSPMTTRSLIQSVTISTT
jgi:hypothetical protein